MLSQHLTDDLIPTKSNYYKQAIALKTPRIGIVSVTGIFQQLGCSAALTGRKPTPSGPRLPLFGDHRIWSAVLAGIASLLLS